MHWRRVLSFVLLCAFTIPLSALAVHVARDRRERAALRELGDRAEENAQRLAALLASAASRREDARAVVRRLGAQSVVLDPGLAFVAHPKLGKRRGVLLPMEVAESLRHDAAFPLLLQNYRDPLDSTGARWLAAFAPAGRTGYFSLLQVRAPDFALGTALAAGLGLAALLWALSSGGRRRHVGA